MDPADNCRKNASISARCLAVTFQRAFPLIEKCNLLNFLAGISIHRTKIFYSTRHVAAPWGLNKNMIPLHSPRGNAWRAKKQLFPCTRHVAAQRGAKANTITFYSPRCNAAEAKQQTIILH